MSFEGNPGGYSATEDAGGPRNAQQQAAQKRMQQTQAQVEEVVGIMRVNVEKVLERDQKLSELDNRADALQQGASQFEQQANKLKRKFWWKNLKMMIIMGVIAVALIIIVILVIKYSGEDSSSTSTNPVEPTPAPAATAASGQQAVVTPAPN
uniref:Synaptobrevin n=1 Tax=Gryllus bimaculatus TaxID=6999 RepID=F5HSC3_GRYBI|nr:synaptobrevin [Gryllus bimaculatus]